MALWTIQLIKFKKWNYVTTTREIKFQIRTKQMNRDEERPRLSERPPQLTECKLLSEKIKPNIIYLNKLYIETSWMVISAPSRVVWKYVKIAIFSFHYGDTLESLLLHGRFSWACKVEHAMGLQWSFENFFLLADSLGVERFIQSSFLRLNY